MALRLEKSCAGAPDGRVRPGTLEAYRSSEQGLARQRGSAAHALVALVRIELAYVWPKVKGRATPLIKWSFEPV